MPRQAMRAKMPGPAPYKATSPSDTLDTVDTLAASPWPEPKASRVSKVSEGEHGHDGLLPVAVTVAIACRRAANWQPQSGRSGGEKRHIALTPLVPG